LTLQVSSSTTITSSITTPEMENGLDFILFHFDQDNRQQQLFPRKIQTSNSEGRQIEVFSKQETLLYFKESSFLDCRINAFPSYTEYKGIQRYPPDLIFIDIDRSNFKDDKSFENALSKTKKNIKEKLNDGYPTINWSGNGYHILQPIECPILEQIEQFQKYKNKNNFFISQEFLRFAKDYLSNGKADKNNYPSFKSCQIRIPGSINGKCLYDRGKRLSGNFKVKTLQRWNGSRTSVSREFLEDFRTYLEQKVTDQENSINNFSYKYKNHSNHYSNNNRIEWIEKILLHSIEDGRKKIVNLILAPYLVVVKNLSFDESYQIINEWLQKCDLLSGRKLDFNARSFVNTAIAIAYKKQIPPMSINTLKTNYHDLYSLIVQKGKEGEARRR